MSTMMRESILEMTFRSLPESTPLACEWKECKEPAEWRAILRVNGQVMDTRAICNDSVHDLFNDMRENVRKLTP